MPEQVLESSSTKIENELTKSRHDWLYKVLLILILAIGAYFRFTGINWDEGQYLHPDERFLAMVESAIEPVEGFGEYFNTQVSSLNPHNRGHGFFVYGTLPIFLVRYVAEWIEQTGYGDIYWVGRPLSALADLAVVLIVFLIAERIYDKRVGLLAAAFSSMAVLQIQLSHFFTVDTFANLFTILALYFAVLIGTKRWEQSRTVSRGDLWEEKKTGKGSGLREESERQLISIRQEESSLSETQNLSLTDFFSKIYSHPLFLPMLLFGTALGMAVASKVSSAPAALLLPLSAGIYLSRVPQQEQKGEAILVAALLGLSGILSVLVFRVFQPYAFSGPGFFDIEPNPLWLDNLRALRGQIQPDSGFPPSIQWFNRSFLYSGENLFMWGIGPAMGTVALFGFLWMGWRIFRGDLRKNLLLWTWTGIYFIWQSSQWNPTMRYQLPVYPTLAIIAGWAVVKLWDKGIERVRGDRLESENYVSSLQTNNLRSFSGVYQYARPLAFVLGGMALVLTFAWAFAFTRIYTRPVTRIEASRWIYQNIPGPLNLQIENSNGFFSQPLPYPQGYMIRPGQPFETNFVAKESGDINKIKLGHILLGEGEARHGALSIQLFSRDNGGMMLGETVLTTDFPQNDFMQVSFSKPVVVVEGEPYFLKVSLESGVDQISLAGAAIAVETSWDDALPARIDGYDGFGGIYQGGLNLELYWEDNAEKRQRMLDILNKSDVIPISSSRQWASLTRLPQKYPLTSAYYRNLLGCPQELVIEWCYNVAEPGMFQENLGFELVKTFQSDPNLGSWEINDQFAEEAFTVYDHPKVFVFIKSENYDPSRTRAVLNAAPLATDGVPVTSQQPDEQKTLMLPENRLETQLEGGTWSQLFDRDGLLNRYPFLGLIFWYAAVGVIGIFAYPIVRVMLFGFTDRGYPFSRTVGLLIFSYLVWLAGSNAIPVNRMTISGAAVVLIGISGVLAFFQRVSLKQEWQTQKRYFLIVEGLALAFFIFFLAIRVGNPDLWHPWKGGEKPMDFSYFNAVLKSTTFPPYDPWFAGGYINYYYYGFVYVGVLVKWLGIVPAVAYNLALPTLFMLTALGVFSLGWNLTFVARIGEWVGVGYRRVKSQAISPYLVGLAASIGAVVLGNLGTVRMIFRGYLKMAAPPGVVVEEVGFVHGWVLAIQGFFKALSGASVPYSIGDWYWLPSRAIPAPNEVEPITEFPFFSFLYGDLHAHLIALPLTILALAWAVSFVLGHARKRSSEGGLYSYLSLQIIVSLLLGGLAIGVLRPTNTWDFPTYLALGVIAVGYSVWRYYSPKGMLSYLPNWLVRLAVAGIGIGTLVAISLLLYQPYSAWYALGYTSAKVWDGAHTPVSAYLVHWGLFLFLIVSWMIWETREWMANTPVSALRKLVPYRELITAAVLVLLIWMGAMLFMDIHIAWLVLPLMTWAGMLNFRPGLPESKRIVLFLVGSGLFLTLIVEVIVLSGDIGRMNTVFKFYLQIWIIFSISAAATLGWLIPVLSRWESRLRFGWQVILGALVFSVSLYTLMGGVAKIKDRMAPSAPHTLNGMMYMQYATYQDQGKEMDLRDDFQSIRWMQENVTGSPVIVEANTVEYRWGTRYTIYTGLPNVVGWNWHQRQQRGISGPGKVEARVSEVQQFYRTTDPESVQAFLDTYDVEYIVVGQLEKAYYEGPGLQKFEDWDGVLWREVFRTGETIIYKVSGS